MVRGRPFGYGQGEAVWGYGWGEEQLERGRRWGVLELQKWQPRFEIEVAQGERTKASWETEEFREQPKRWPGHCVMCYLPWVGEDLRGCGKQG